MVRNNRKTIMLKIKLYTSILLKGKIDYICPECGERGSFFMSQDVSCAGCRKILPPMNKIIENEAARQAWHFFGLSTD